MRSDCHFTLRMLAAKVQVIVGTVWTIVHYKSRYRKMCAHWIPMQLTDQQKELSMEKALQRLFLFHKDSDFLKYHQARSCLQSFSASQVHYLLHSSSTKEPLHWKCTVRQWKPTKVHQKKKGACSLWLWFWSIITDVHTNPRSHTWNGPNISLSNVTIYPTVWSCCIVISICLVPWKKFEKAALQLGRWTQ